MVTAAPHAMLLAVVHVAPAASLVKTAYLPTRIPMPVRHHAPTMVAVASIREASTPIVTFGCAAMDTAAPKVHEATAAVLGFCHKAAVSAFALPKSVQVAIAIVAVVGTLVKIWLARRLAAKLREEEERKKTDVVYAFKDLFGAVSGAAVEVAKSAVEAASEAVNTPSPPTLPMPPPTPEKTQESLKPGSETNENVSAKSRLLQPPAPPPPPPPPPPQPESGPKKASLAPAGFDNSEPKRSGKTTSAFKPKPSRKLNFLDSLANGWPPPKP